MASFSVWSRPMKTVARAALKNTPTVSNKRKVALELSQQAQRRLSAGDMDAALVLLDSLKKKDLRPTKNLYETFLRAFYQSKQWNSAFSMLEEMNSYSITPNLSILNVMIERAAKSKELNIGYALLEEIRLFNLQPDQFSFTSLIDAAGKKGDWIMVDKLLSEMKDLNIEPSLVTLNTLIDICSRDATKFDRAEMYFKRITCIGQKPDVISYTGMINATLQVGNAQNALEYFKEMKQLGIWPSNRTLVVILRGMKKLNKPMEAYQLLVSAIESGAKPNLYVYNALISVLGPNRHFTYIQRVLDMVTAQGIAPDVITYNTLLHSYSKASRVEDLFNTYEEMIEKKIEPDAITYSTLISASLKNNLNAKASELFLDMTQRGIVPSEDLTKRIFFYCSHTQNVELATLVINEFKRIGMLNISHVNELMKLYDCDVTNIRSLFDDIESLGLQADAESCRILISALLKNDKPREAFDCYLQLQTKGSTMNPHTSQKLQAALQQNNMKDEYQALRKSLTNQNFKK